MGGKSPRVRGPFVTRPTFAALRGSSDDATMPPEWNTTER